MAAFVATTTFVKLFDALRKATFVNNVFETFPVNDEAGMFVKLAPLPIKFVALTVPARKLPVASRSTIVFARSAGVAAFAATAPLATRDAGCPPTAETTVAPCVPVTSPVSEPEKLVAVVAESAAVAEFAVVAEVALPVKLPVKEPLI